MNCRHTVAAVVLLLVLLTTVPPRAQTPAPGAQTAPVSCESQAGIIKPFGTGEDGDLLCDSDGLIVHQPSAEHPYGDGGDTAQREGWYWLGVWIRQNTPGVQPWPHRRKLNFDQVLRLLEPNRDGVFYRHPKLAPWNNPYDKKFGFSRDQMVPLVAAMGVWGKQEELRRLWDALPDDALGKHSFNGNWRNLLGQDGVDCTAIRRRNCDATRSCPLKTDTRDCSLKSDTRSCPLQEDTRSCSVCLISNPFGGCILYGNDPICELAKAAQNAIYKANKDACEAAKAAQNVIYAGEKAACETAKATQNAIYKGEKDACEVVKAGEKLTCETQKAAELNICRLNNIHSGDFIGPMTENLFARARGESLSDWKGEAELLANVLLRIHDASDRDNTGDDLNLLVMLLMSKLRTPTAQSESSVALYASMRPFSYGSYLKSYRAVYGNDATDMTQRIDAGIGSGWKPDAPPANGAVHWYHRVETGGNEQLAELYDPIINRFIYGDRTGTFGTPPSTNPSPTVSSVTPSAGLSSGGTVISITGTGFIPGTTVLVDGVPAGDIVVVNSTTVTAVTPAHVDGLVSISVTVPWPGGGTTTRRDAFTYQSTAPAPLPVLPIGTVDTPTDNQTGVTGAIPFTGWALDDKGVESVTICRAAIAGESAPVDPNCGGAAQIYVGAGVFIDGARPDVQAAYPWYPQNNRAGWGFMVLTNMLPNRGNGTFVFSVYARDREGLTARLGVRSLTCDNSHATRPFGTIDTPAQGATVFGTAYVNFGWALTQNPKAIPSDGSTMTVYIDGVAVAKPSYNYYRSDIASLFPGLANSQGAVGYHTIDTTALANGLHTIAWTVTDSNGITAGLGSRFFRVANGVTASAASTSAEAGMTAATTARAVAAAPVTTSPLVGRRGWDPETAWKNYPIGRSGRAVMRGEEADRFEVRLEQQSGARYTGYVRVENDLKALPAGSRLNAATGEFTWSPGAGFVGAYDFVFVRWSNRHPVARQEARIILHPKGSGHIGSQVTIDAPAEPVVAQPFLLGGWAGDLDAEAGTGVDTLHVWAYPVTGGRPIFLGTPTYGAERPDVAAVHGDRFGESGYGMTVDGLPPGSYDLAVFPWSNVSSSFAPPKVVRVTIR